VGIPRDNRLENLRIVYPYCAATGAQVNSGWQPWV